ncbi:MAG TPA: tail fiber protein [Caulobacteraceae bacterium]|nr:tail fiber protein [Caulobacteraceae bacterium]
MGTPYLGEIKITSFNFAPKGWALCNGQLLPINQNQALFSILGTTYGGDGRVTFGLPDLRGRVPVHVGSGIILGERLGEEFHTLNISELPQHTHFVRGLTADAATGAPGRKPDNTKYLAEAHAAVGTTTTTPAQIYGSGGVSGSMDPTSVTFLGGNQPHNNLQPYLVLNMVIALQGVFPSQN